MSRTRGFLPRPSCGGGARSTHLFPTAAHEPLPICVLPSLRLLLGKSCVKLWNDNTQLSFHSPISASDLRLWGSSRARIGLATWGKRSAGTSSLRMSLLTWTGHRDVSAVVCTPCADVGLPDR